MTSRLSRPALIVALGLLAMLTNRAELFLNVMNTSNAGYATFGVLGDPTGIGAPGIPIGAAINEPGVGNRFESPAPPISAFAGLRLRF